MKIPAFRLRNLAICGGNPNDEPNFLLQAHGNDCKCDLTDLAHFNIIPVNKILRRELNMAYDEGVAQRLRDMLQKIPAVSERKMLGGIAFMVNGNMCVGVLKDTLMLRVGLTSIIMPLNGHTSGKWILPANQ